MENLIILGSGRSGTSMFAGIMAMSGYNLGKNADYLKTNRANPKGFFEDLEVNTINEDILRKSLFEIPERFRRKFFPFYTFYRARWLACFPLYYNFRADESIRRRIKKVTELGPFCFKDPRFSYTLPVWEEHLGEQTKYLVVFREPSKTVQSIVRECRDNGALRKLKMNEKRAMKVWLYMYSHILKHYDSGDKEKWFFVHYDQAFDSEKMDQLKNFTKTALSLDFPEKQISRSVENDMKVGRKLYELYDRLNELATYKPKHEK